MSISPNVKKLALEFAWPAAVASAWTALSWCFVHKNSAVDVQTISIALVKEFATAFFFAAFFSGNLVRVKKTARSEEYFAKITEIVTGGASFPMIMPVLKRISNDDEWYPVSLMLSKQGSHSLYDLTAVVTDIDRMQQLHQHAYGPNMPAFQEKFQVGTVGNAQEERLSKIDVGDREAFNFEIRSYARNGQFVQRLSLRPVGNSWASATCIEHDGKEVLKHVASNYPDKDLTYLSPSVQVPARAGS